MYVPGFRNARSIAFAELAMNAARFLRRRIVGHEQRNLMAVIKIIEIHEFAPRRKREHIWSLSRAKAYRTFVAR